MDSEDYKIDKVAIFEQQQIIATEEYSLIEKKCDVQPITFLKENFSNKKIRDRKTEPNFYVILSVAWSKICVLAGIKNAVDEIIARDITKMVLTTYSSLSIEEICKAFELERYSVYNSKTDHFQLFNADYVSAILKKYIDWKQETIRTKYIKNPALELREPEIDNEKKKKIVNDGIIRVFNEYKETKTIPEPFSYIFDELLERNIIKNVSKNNPAIEKYYQEKLNQAYKEIKTELKQEPKDTISKKNDIKNELEKISNMNSEKAQIRAKRIVLMEFFDKHISLGTNFNEFIKTK